MSGKMGPGTDFPAHRVRYFYTFTLSHSEFFMLRWPLARPARRHRSWRRADLSGCDIIWRTRAQPDGKAQVCLERGLSARVLPLGLQRRTSWRSQGPKKRVLTARCGILKQVREE